MCRKPVSEKFKQRLKLSSTPAYKMAWQAGLHPNTLSKYTTGYLHPKCCDERLIKLGELLGLGPDEIYEKKRCE